MAARSVGTLGSDSCTSAGEARTDVWECGGSLECRVIRSIVSGRLLARRQIALPVGAAAGHRGVHIHWRLPAVSGGGRLPSVRARSSHARPSS